MPDATGTPGTPDATLTAEQAGKILDDHPLFKKAVTEFMMLLDAAEVLDDLKPPMHETASAYLRECANAHIRNSTTLPEEFIQAMTDHRPPLHRRS